MQISDFGRQELQVSRDSSGMSTLHKVQFHPDLGIQVILKSLDLFCIRSRYRFERIRRFSIEVEMN